MRTFTSTGNKVVIILDEECQLEDVVPDPAHALKGTGTFTWKIVKKGGGECKVKICFKDPTLIPFDDAKWQDGCETGTDEITGNLKELTGLNGELSFPYSIEVGGQVWDPTIILH